MLGRLIILQIMVFSGWALAQSSTQETLPLEDTKNFLMDDVDIEAIGEESTRSFVGKSFDQEVDKDEIQKSQAQTVSEVLDQIPGVENVGGTRKEAQNISIRGFQKNQVLLLLDGTRSNFSMTHNSIIPVRMHLLKRIDVIKGGASSRFGNGALGGLMSFSTISAHDLIPRGSEYAVQLRSLYSDVSALNQSSMTMGTVFGKKRQGGLIVDATSTQAQDVELSNNQALAYSGFEDQSLWAKASYEFANKNFIWFSAEDHGKDSRTPDNPNLDESSENSISDLVEDYRAFKFQYKKGGASRIRPELIVYQSDTEMTRDRVGDRRFDSREVKTLGASLHSTMDIIRQTDSQPFQWRLQPGFELVSDKNTGKRRLPGATEFENLPNFPTGDAQHIGAYILTDLVYQEKYWSQLGMRYDEVTLATEDPNLENRRNKSWSPEIEAGVQFNESWRLSAGYEEGYRAPRIQDIYVDGFHFPGVFGNNNFIPNPNLQPEESQTVEVKLGYDYGPKDFQGTLEVIGYESVVDNYIDQDVDFLGGTTQFVNTPQVKFQGRELGWKQSIQRVSLGASYSRVRSLKSVNGQPLSNSPADQFRTLVGYDSRQWFWGFENVVFFQQDRIDKTIVGAIDSTPGASIYNTMAGYRSSGKITNVTSRLKLNNIFNTEYQRHGSPLKAPGRDIRLELVITFKGDKRSAETYRNYFSYNGLRGSSQP